MHGELFPALISTGGYNHYINKNMLHAIHIIILVINLKNAVKLKICMNYT